MGFTVRIGDRVIGVNASSKEMKRVRDEVKADQLKREQAREKVMQERMTRRDRRKSHAGRRSSVGYF